MLLGGVGIYVLISVAIRLVQTPTSSGYGFCSSVITAGLMLTPFSATAFVASRTIPPRVRRRHGNLLPPAACGLVSLCLVAFAFLHRSLLQVFVVRDRRRLRSRRPLRGNARFHRPLGTARDHNERHELQPRTLATTI